MTFITGIYVESLIQRVTAPNDAISSAYVNSTSEN
jgi:hypothetical protein